MSGPEKVFLHIGLHKTGTTYLQNLMRANREALRGQGIEFPGGPGEPSQQMAVWDLQGRRPRGLNDKRIGGQWAALTEHVANSSQPVVLLSEEHFSLSTPKQVASVVGAFADAEIHVIVTTRDLARIVVSQWQEAIKNNRTWTWDEYLSAVKAPQGQSTTPGRGFWARHDLARVCDLWHKEVPAERIHLVTVPVAGGDPDLLLKRFGSIVGIDDALLVEPAAWSNEAIGVPATEVIRRVNLRLDGRLNQREQDWVIKRTVVRLLAEHKEQPRAGLPESEYGWVEEHTEQTIRELEERGYDVVGDLADLRPVPRPASRRPDDASDLELLESALDALSLLAERSAKMWWERRREVAHVDAGTGGSVGDRTRSAVFAGQRKALQVADRNRIAGKVVDSGLRWRERWRTRKRDM